MEVLIREQPRVCMRSGMVTETPESVEPQSHSCLATSSPLPQPPTRTDSQIHPLGDKLLTAAALLSLKKSSFPGAGEMSLIGQARIERWRQIRFQQGDSVCTLRLQSKPLKGRCTGEGIRVSRDLDSGSCPCPQIKSDRVRTWPLVCLHQCLSV